MKALIQLFGFFVIGLLASCDQLDEGTALRLGVSGRPIDYRYHVTGTFHGEAFSIDERVRCAAKRVSAPLGNALGGFRYEAEPSFVGDVMRWTASARGIFVPKCGC